jgi:hypothetical protein
VVVGEQPDDLGGIALRCGRPNVPELLREAALGARCTPALPRLAPALPRLTAIVTTSVVAAPRCRCEHRGPCSPPSPHRIAVAIAEGGTHARAAAVAGGPSMGRVAVLACGPASLVDAAKAGCVCTRGDFDFHSEVFEW